jgi:N-acetylmuramoyl-L-alanine amidase
MKICVDAGHGGSDLGAIGTKPKRYEEKTFALRLAKLLEGELEERGHWTVMTRRKDRDLGLSARAKFANRLGADLFVSIHANGAATPKIEGMEVFHYPGSTAGKMAASLVLARMKAAFPGHKRRGVKEADFAVLRLTDMPAILVECEFITNPKQLRFLRKRANQEALAKAIADGVDRVASGL